VDVFGVLLPELAALTQHDDSLRRAELFQVALDTQGHAAANTLRSEVADVPTASEVAFVSDSGEAMIVSECVGGEDAPD
jgi:hypothetical protein